jgi:MFS transporter, DHA2 family, multidrug resistance protein
MMNAEFKGGGVLEAVLEPEVAAPWSPSHSRWTIASVVALAAFMEVLDVSIANVAVPHIAGSLASSNDEATWVLTSYLVSNAIVLPISGWFAGAVGRKRYFMLSLAVFTFSSLLCGLAPTLGSLIFFRILQGAGGGGMQPMAQAILADTFPHELRGQAFAVYGMTTVVAPVIGPTLGGWITDNYSWRWIFLINIGVGIVALALILRLLEDPPYLKELAKARLRIDYIGFGLLALGVGCLQVLLDKGQEDDWFGSHFIVTLVVVATVSLVALAIYEWYRKNPVIEVRLFANFNFLSANVMMFMVGLMMFGSLVLMPLFLQTQMGYTAEIAGIVLSFGAVITLFELPLVGRLTAKVSARSLIAVGWLAMAVGMFVSTRQVDLYVSFWSMARLRMLQLVGLPFLFIPLTMIAYAGLPSEKNNSISGIINFTRNIGMSFGTSIVTTMIARRSQFHQQILAAHVTDTNPHFRATLNALANLLAHAGLNSVAALDQAYARIYQQIVGQSVTLAYVDTFKALAVGSAVMLALAIFLKRNEPGTGGSAAAG